jgi:hypothetical protein
MASEEPVSAAAATYPTDVKESPNVEHDLVDDQTVEVQRPTGWKHRERKIGNFSLGWYASPNSQLLMVSFVCFLCPGMFNALGGLGGGGQTDATLADNMVSDHPSVVQSSL